MIRILIVDDHAILREGLRSLLGTYPDLEVVGEAASGQEAISLTEALKPELVLLDIGMPGMTGLQALKKIKELFPEVKVLFLTQYDTEAYLFTALQSGGSGYVLKETAGSELVSAIRTVHEGRVYLSPSMTGNLVTELLTDGESVKKAKDAITPREEEVLRFLAEGYTSQEAANALGISFKTVQTHRYHIMEKLDLHNSAELVRYAIRKGIISPA